MEYEIVHARVGDLEPTFFYLNDLFASRPDVFYLQPEGMPRDAIRSLMEESHVSNDKLFLIAKLGADVVGTLTLSRYENQENRHCGEFGMSVHPEHRRRGLGRRLIEAMEAWALSHGIVKIELRVWSNNIPALGLYNAVGYQVEGIRKAGVVRDGHVRDVILMGKLIGRGMAGLGGDTLGRHVARNAHESPQ